MTAQFSAATIIRTSLEWSLCILLVLAGPWSLEWLLTGLTFGFSLWRLDRAFAIVMWFAVVLFPGFVGWALTKSFKARSLATTVRLTLIAWGFTGLWLWEVYVLSWGW